MRAHIFVDAENINPVMFDLSYKDLKSKYEIANIDIFSKKDSLPHKYKIYTNEKFNFVMCNNGKNSADTFMTSYIVKAVYEEILTEVFVILTQDMDFTPAIKVVTDNNKQVILVTEKNRILQNLKPVGVNMKYFSNIEYDIPIKSKIKNMDDYWKNIIPDVCYRNIQEYDLTKTIFILNNRTIIETFFNNGMKFSTFLNTLSKGTIKRIRRGYAKSAKLTNILKKSFLIVIDDRIYCDMDKIWKKEEE